MNNILQHNNDINFGTTAGPTLTINLQHIVNNYKFLRNSYNGKYLVPVIKDDAYGLGALSIAKKLYHDCNCDKFFVATVQEAIIIADALPNVIIYVLHGINPSNAIYFKGYKSIIPVINSIAQLQLWVNQYTIHAPIALHVETGFNRTGITTTQINHIIDNYKQLNISLVLSHLACGDDCNHILNKSQLQQFNYIKAQLQQHFPHTDYSLCASDGIALGDDYHFDMARTGAALYGINNITQIFTDLKSVITLSAPIMQIKTLLPGQYVGYGATYAIQLPTKLATIEIGYGDGLFRCLGQGVGRVFINIKDKIYAAPIVGRISMDMITCDVTMIPDIDCATHVQLLNDHYTADDMAMDAGTIGYEVLTRLKQAIIDKYQRIYL